MDSTNRQGSYTRELDKAVEAAQAAGALLRAEFHRPGGPRGSGEHAEADAEAEQLIYERLAGAFPDYGFRGEEGGLRRAPRGPARRLWLVDPNDGTSAFLKGFRGAAVSIALLEAGVPVIGVIYAYCAPDDRGDLFCWGEGAGPLLRNGAPVEARLPEAPAAELTVLVSHRADVNSEANAHVAAPMRFRAVVGIAYRLALVAAGEGALGVSLYSPCGWDYAAGHALLRACGGEVYDFHGRPVTYTETGESHCGAGCFGGSASLVDAVVSRDWTRVLARTAGAEPPYGLCWPVRGRAVTDAGVLSRAQGCLLGQVAGDSLGGLVEFRSAAEIANAYPGGIRRLTDGGVWGILAGQPTDDSEMALMLARSLLQAGGYDPEQAARAYCWWRNSGPFDCGGTVGGAVSAAASALRSGRAAAEAARSAASTSSQANGALMRVSPIGIAGASAGYETAERWAREDALLTHPHPAPRDANAVFASALAFAIATGASSGEVYEHARARARALDAEPSVTAALDAAAEGPPDDYASQQGWVLIALRNAFYQLVHAESLQAGVAGSVMHGGDTDTNAAIAGALLGAVLGREAIPFQWMDRVLTCRPIAGLAGVGKARPEALWPVDALGLAERLLLVPMDR